MSRSVDRPRRRTGAAPLCIAVLCLAGAGVGRARAWPLQEQPHRARAAELRIFEAAAVHASELRAAVTSAEPARRNQRDDVEIDRDPRRREGPTLGLAYSMGFPARDLREFERSPSLRGIDLSLAFPVYRSLQLGAVLSYNGFYQEAGVVTYPFDAGAVTAKLYVSAEFWTLAAMARYFFLPPLSPLRPWLGLRVGGSVLSTTTFVADREAPATAVGALVAPELGIVLRIVEPLYASAVYQYNFTTNTFRAYERLSYGALQLGMMFKFQ